MIVDNRRLDASPVFSRKLVSLKDLHQGLNLSTKIRHHFKREYMYYDAHENEIENKE